MIAACRDEGGLCPISLGEFKTEGFPIKGDGALEIRHIQMNVSDANTGINWRIPIHGL